MNIKSVRSKTIGVWGFSHTALAGLAFALPACSGAPDPSGTGDSPGIAARLPAPAAGRTTTGSSHVLEVAPSGSEVFARVGASGACFLHAPGDSTNQLEVIPDEEGAIRLDVTPDLTRGSMDLEVDCKDEHGAQVRHSMSITVNESMPKIGPVQKSPAGFERLPLNDDPARLSEAELVARGYPPMPDASAKPGAYAEWLATVSRPVTMTVPTLIETSVKNDVHTSIWSGIVDTAVTGGQYVLIQGAWTVPTVNPSPYQPPPVSSKSSFWVGLDGFGTPDVIQDGTEQAIFFLGSGWLRQYYAWIEYFPNSEFAISNFPVRAGDSIFAEAWTCDAQGFVKANGGSGCFYIQNNTTGQSTQWRIVKPGGLPNYAGTSAEWIMERPSVNGTPTALANYGSARMTSAFAYDTKNAWLDWFSRANVIVNMYNPTNSSHVLSAATPSPPDQIQYLWFFPL